MYLLQNSIECHNAQDDLEIYGLETTIKHIFCNDLGTNDISYITLLYAVKKTLLYKSRIDSDNAFRTLDFLCDI